MKEEILKNLDNPKALEKLYHRNKIAFKKDFCMATENVSDQPIVQFWEERLNYESEAISWGSRKELFVVIFISFIAGIIAKIPDFTYIKSEFFYPRNIGFVIFPALTFYFWWKQKYETKKLIILSLLILVSVIYINLLPDSSTSNTLILACIHLPLFLWSILAYSFVGASFNNFNKRLAFLRFNGDLLVMTGIILIAGGIMTGITIGLFSLIKIDIKDFYFKNIVVMGLAAAPIVGTYLVQTNPQLVNKVSPAIAKVFTPLVLITLVFYLIAVMSTGKNPYNDREFLIIFNGLLIGVMALILFSTAETSKYSKNNLDLYLLLALSIVTLIINGIALSAILFRIFEWGLSPNRIAVLGGNMIIFANLFFVTFSLIKATKNRMGIEIVEKSISSFLPIYATWTVLIIFILPMAFHFK